MGFRNDCCRAHFLNVNDPLTGDSTTCPVCGNEHVWDGLRWQNPHELGAAKMRKLARIRHANQYASNRLGLDTSPTTPTAPLFPTTDQ